MTMTITKPHKPRVRTDDMDRRTSTRFPVEFEVRYTHDRRTGTGRTRDMSSTGILFTTDNFLPFGLRLSVSIDWPVRLPSGTRLQLITDAIVVRSVAGVVAVNIGRSEFKTRRSQ
jgi:hypothetical protein